MAFACQKALSLRIFQIKSIACFPDFQIGMVMMVAGGQGAVRRVK